LIIATFFAPAAWGVLKEVNPDEGVCCVILCRLGIVLNVLLFGGRALWTATHYFGINRLQIILLGWVTKEGLPDRRARAFNFFWYFLLDFVTSALSMVSVSLLKMLPWIPQSDANGNV
jgi:hypothetical protein